MADKKEDQTEAPAADTDKPAWKGSASAAKPVVAPDGHVNLSQEDIDART